MAVKEQLYIFGTLKDVFGAINVICEHHGIPGRRFRFDYAVPKYKLAIEYEGIFSDKSRHTSITGYAKDCEKYNLATLNKWTVLRYTAKNISQLESDIDKFLKNQWV